MTSVETKSTGSSFLRRAWLAACCGSALCFSLPATAFDFAGNKWTGATTDFYVQLSGTAFSGIRWHDAFMEALEEWNEKTAFTFVPVQEFLNPCNIDLKNSVDFTDDVCGSEYGSNTLAVTLTRLESQILGPPKLIEADIVVNNGVQYNIYDGRIPQFGVPGLDFRRVALHELGHALGLRHEPVAAAIMSPNIGNIDRLQIDDIEGVNTLYGGLSNCGVKALGFGIVSDALSASDCTVAQLTVGGGDTSFIDVYQLEIGTTTTLELEMKSSTLDSVLILANSAFEYIDFDDKSGGNCDSTLDRVLTPGLYYVLANTYDIPVRSDCGNVGEYTLTVGYSSSALRELSGSISLAGGLSSASYQGGVTANNGGAFGNVFTSEQSLDIVAEIDIDPEHQGSDGFLVVAALLDGQILLQNGALGAFEPYNPEAGIPHVADKTLDASEIITIAENLIPAALNIDSISVDFVVGYGLASNPDEVYHHSNPINLTVTP